MGRAQVGAVSLSGQEWVGTQTLQRTKSLSFKVICSLVGGRHPADIGWGLREVGRKLELDFCRTSRNLSRTEEAIPSSQKMC